MYSVYKNMSRDIAFPIRLHVHKANTITKTCLYNFDPLKPHFYIVKLWFTGVYIIFLISAKIIDCWCSLEPPRGGGSNEYSQSMFWAEIWKISEFLSENFQFLVVKFSIYLYRRVFVLLIRVFAVRLKTLWIFEYRQSALRWLSRLCECKMIGVFAGRTCNLEMVCPYSLNAMHSG